MSVELKVVFVVMASTGLDATRMQWPVAVYPAWDVAAKHAEVANHLVASTVTRVLASGLMTHFAPLDFRQSFPWDANFRMEPHGTRYKAIKVPLCSSPQEYIDEVRHESNTPIPFTPLVPLEPCYLVIGTSGLWSAAREWVVACYQDKDQALSHVSEATILVDDFASHIVDGITLYHCSLEERDSFPLDIKFLLSRTGTEYSLAEMPLVLHPDQYLEDVRYCAK